MADIGPYRIIASISDSGQALSYRAVHVHLEREVFLKVLPAGGPGWQERRARFEREAKALARIDHPAVVRVYDFGEVDGKLFLASEYLEGPDLAHRLAQGPLPWPEVEALALRLLEGLEALHAAGIVHRDIKPSNILLSTGGPKLADLGLARLLQNPAATQSDALVGTPAYMDPEMLRGRAADARSDLFSLGATLYEAFAGKRAFPGATFQEAVKALLETDPMLSLPEDTPEDARRFLGVLLEKQAERRPRDVAEARAILFAERCVPPAARRRESWPVWMFAVPAIVAAIAVVTTLPRLRGKYQNPPIAALSAGIDHDSVVVSDVVAPPSHDVLKEAPEEPVTVVRRKEQGPSHEPALATASASPPDALPLARTRFEESAMVWITSVPWAEVRIDGDVVDTTPLSGPLTLAPGRHEVTLAHPAFPAVISILQLAPGTMESLRVSLAESLGFVHVHTDPWATVQVDGIAAGTTPLAAPIALRPGSHEVRAENPFFPPENTKVTVAPGETTVVQITLREGSER